MDKTNLLMDLIKQNAINGNRILSRNMEYFYDKRKIKLNAFQNIVAIFKINSIDCWVFCFYM